MRFIFITVFMFLTVFASAVELITTNAGFESGDLTGWTILAGAPTVVTDPATGTYASRSTGLGGGSYATIFTYDNTKAYILSANVKVTLPIAWGGIGVHYLNGSFVQIAQSAIATSSTSYTNLSLSLTPPSGTVHIRVWFWSDGAGNVFADNFSLTENIPLPVELITFNSTVIDDKSVRLDWQTGSETTNDFFTIERSKEGIAWEIVSTVNSSGNLSTLQSYSEVDRSPYLGTSYYRLKQTDYNGQFGYSQLRLVHLTTVEKIEIYPNPTSDKIIIKGSLTELEDILIYTSMGQNMSVKTALSSVDESSLEIDFSAFDSGTYFVKTKTTTKKVVKE